MKFVFITGITEYTPKGVYSSLNNLNKISHNTKYSNILGFTQK
ncbi:MAG: hypothetical protein B6I29_05470, partial [Marinitoga sp. 4572_148]